MVEIERLQKHLLLIRRTVGWTAEEFGERIGVTRQTINNIESGRNKLSKTQYIAIRSVLDAEMIESPEDTGMLKVLLDVLVDNPESYTEQQRDEYLTKASLMAPSILAGTATRANVTKEWVKMVGLAAGVGVAAGVGAAFGPLAGALTVSSWLAKSISKSKKERKE